MVFTARNGATLGGRVWFTRAGPAKRPGVVIVNGSVQASETLYWFEAQTLAKAGYVVLTFDPQNQGRSDSRGEAPDGDEGFPAQSDGRPFFDGAQDALDFFLSTPAAPYRPQPSCNSGTIARAQAGAPRGRRAGHRLQPAVAADRHRAGRDRRALLRRGRRLLRRPARPAREGRGGVGRARAPAAGRRARQRDRRLRGTRRSARRRRSPSRR